MKKYLGFLMFLGVLGLMTSTYTALAIEGNTSTTTSVNVNTSGGGRGPGLNAGVRLGADAGLRMGNNMETRDAWERAHTEKHERMDAERKAFMDKLRLEREEFKAKVAKEKEEWKTESAEMKKEFWNKVGVVVGQRFTVAISHIEEAQVRVGDIIVKLNADGKDTTDIKANLDLSKSKLADAKAKLAEIKALLPDTGEKITAEVFAQIKVKAREAKDLLKESVESIRDAIKEIKSLREVKASAQGGANVDVDGEDSN